MGSRILVAFFSPTGTTKKVAQVIADVTGGDLFEIVPKTPYTKADLNWQDKQSRSSLEMADPTSRPELGSDVEGIRDRYDTIYLGFPIWWYTAPHIIQTFLESHDLSGKVIVPFATSGSSGMGDTVETLRQTTTPETRWKAGKRLPANASADDVRKWIASMGL